MSWASSSYVRQQCTTCNICGPHAGSPRFNYRSSRTYVYEFARYLRQKQLSKDEWPHLRFEEGIESISKTVEKPRKRQIEDKDPGEGLAVFSIRIIYFLFHHHNRPLSTIICITTRVSPATSIKSYHLAWSFFYFIRVASTLVHCNFYLWIGGEACGSSSYCCLLKCCEFQVFQCYTRRSQVIRGANRCPISWEQQQEYLWV